MGLLRSRFFVIVFGSFLLGSIALSGDDISLNHSLETYSHNKGSIPVFGDQFFSIEPEKKQYDAALEQEIVVQSIGTKWDKMQFNGRPHTPVTIAKVVDQSTFKKWGVPRCLHMPIKLPGNDEIRIPREYAHFEQVIKDIFDFEISHNKNFENYFAYLTVDQGHIPKANYQRVPGPHVDGIPRDKINPERQLIDHSYLVTDAIPTMFYPQRFNMEPYDLNRHHIFGIFRALSDESQTMTVHPFDINLMNAYSVHTPTETHVDVDRTFIRLEFSVLEFDRIGNSVNPFFSWQTDQCTYPFTYQPRPIPDHLIIPPSVFDEKPISNKEFFEKSLEEFGPKKLKDIYEADPRVVSKNSDYQDLAFIAAQIEDPNMEGIVMSKKSKAYAFLLYTKDLHGVYLHTLFTLTPGRSGEAMTYGLARLRQICDEQALRTGRAKGELPVTFVLDQNNEKLLSYLSRSARIAKIDFEVRSAISNH